MLYLRNFKDITTIMLVGWLVLMAYQPQILLQICQMYINENGVSCSRVRKENGYRVSFKQMQPEVSVA